MPLSYDDQQQDFISTVNDALARHCPLSLVRAIGAGEEDRWREIWDHVSGMGLGALLVPESAGGLQLGAVDMVAVLEAAGHFALPVPLATTVGGFVGLVRATGQGMDILRRIAEGTTATLAVPLGDPGGMVAAELDGELLTLHCDGVPGPGRAELIAIPAARREDGGTVLVVAGTSGLGPAVEPAMDPADPIGSLHLKGHRLSDAIVLDGDPRPGLPLAWTAASAELVGVAAELVGRSAAYARDRVQFGVPIGSFQGVKHLLVDVHMSVERARSLTLHAALLIDAGDPRMVAAAHTAKAAASEAAAAAARAAVQVHGGSGITREEDVSLLYLRARQLGQLLGDADFHYACVAAGA